MTPKHNNFGAWESGLGFLFEEERIQGLGTFEEGEQNFNFLISIDNDC